MTRDEAIIIVRRIFTVDGSERKIAHLVNINDDEFPNTDMVNFLFWDFRGLTPEQIVDEAIEREAAYARQASQ